MAAQKRTTVLWLEDISHTVYPQKRYFFLGTLLTHPLHKQTRPITFSIMHFVICGGTGKQGRATIDALLRGPKCQITAMVRDPTSAKSKELEKIGCTLVKGDMMDKESMVKAFSGADGVFVVTALEPFNQVGVDKEIVQGKTAVAACAAAKVPFVVFASVFGSHLKTGIPHFDSKYLIEEDLRASGLKHCILKPACFMDNLLPGRSGCRPVFPLLMI